MSPVLPLTSLLKDLGALAAVHEEVRLLPRHRPDPLPLPAAFSAPRTADEAYRNFLSLGEAYFSGGAEPRVGGQTYILAWPRLHAFLQLHREPLLQRSVVEAELEAGSRLCAELSACLDELQTTPAPTPVPLDTVLAAMARLEQMRGAVRRMGRGCDGARLMALFGVTLPLDSSEPALVADAIAQFLEGAGQNLERLHLFRFVTADLEDLKHHRRVLLSLCPDGVGESVRGRADCLLAALEGFFASIATAIAQVFSEQDSRRREGLALIPRAQERRRSDHLLA